MAAIKNLKKDIHNTLGDLIEACYVWEFNNEGAYASKTQEILNCCHYFLFLFDANLVNYNGLDVINKLRYLIEQSLSIL